MLQDVTISEYKKAVEWFATNKSSYIFPYSSREHALAILEAIFSHSREIKMYGECIHHSAMSEDALAIIRPFLESKKKLSIILKKQTDKDSPFYKKLCGAGYSENMEIRMASDVLKNEVLRIFRMDINFIIGDADVFRIEQVSKEHKRAEYSSAMCSFNRRQYTLKLAKVYDKYFRKCLTVTIK